MIKSVTPRVYICNYCDREPAWYWLDIPRMIASYPALRKLVKDEYFGVCSLCLYNGLEDFIIFQGNTCRNEQELLCQRVLFE